MEANMTIKNQEAIKSLYRQRDRFILIGLTGRTGAGCTTVSKILSSDSINKLDLKSYKTCDYLSADERKYSVIYRFMKEGDRWKPFIVIEASSVIFSYILEKSFSELWRFIENLSNEGKINGLENLKTELGDFFNTCDSDESTLASRILDDRERQAFDAITYKSAYEYRDNINIIQTGISIYNLFFVEKKNQFREILEHYTIEKKTDKDVNEVYNLYSYFMQTAGNNIRSSGEYCNSERAAGKEIVIAQRIDQIIKYVELYEELINPNNEKVRVCIDALRNSMEIQYFRDKYRAFYCIAVNTEDKYRIRRINYSKKEIEVLDKIEYPDEGDFYHQNIQACLQLADIYVYNPDVSNKKYFELSEQILKYVGLMLQPGLVTPTHVERCMQLAFNSKCNSGCLSRQVGAIITGEDFSVRSVGWNDVPKGQVSCNLRCVEDYCRNKDPESFSEYELNDELFDEALVTINNSISKMKEEAAEKTGKLYSYCFKDIHNGIKNTDNKIHTRALHAEENAILQIAKYGGAKVEGGKLFSTASPCEACSKKAYQLGITEIYYIDPYPGISRTHILSFGKSGNPRMILFRGAIGNAYISLYVPKMPYKDEIKMVTGVSAKEISAKIYEKYK